MALPWRVARLIDTREESASARTLVLRVDGWPGHLAGQHVDLRLTAEDGYSAQRSYSIASAPDGDVVELTVQQLPDGEVSPFLVQQYAIGDPLEIRGPIGGWFVWTPTDVRPVLLVGGGSGVVPLVAMLRTRRDSSAAAPFRLVYRCAHPTTSCTRWSCTRRPTSRFPCCTRGQHLRTRRGHPAGWFERTSMRQATGNRGSMCAVPQGSSKRQPTCSSTSVTMSGRFAPSGSARAEHDMTHQPNYLDGNALAGALAEVFAVDVSVAATTCAGCGRRSQVAQLHVYSAGPGTIVRCPGCQDAVMRYVRTPTAAILDLRGTISLSVPMPVPPAA